MKRITAFIISFVVALAMSSFAGAQSSAASKGVVAKKPVMTSSQQAKAKKHPASHAHHMMKVKSSKRTHGGKHATSVAKPRKVSLAKVAAKAPIVNAHKKTTMTKKPTKQEQRK